MPNLSLTDKYEQREMCLCVLSKRAELLKSTQGNYILSYIRFINDSNVTGTVYAHMLHVSPGETPKNIP